MHRNSTAVDPARSRATANFYRAATGGPRLDFATVRAAATGRWPALLPALGIDAGFLRDRHGPCPGCGGRDRFRFDDRDGAGTWLCGGAGRIESGDGFGLLSHCHGWTPAEALHRVADVLGLRDGRELPPIQPRRPAPAAPDHEAAAVRAARLWASASGDAAGHPYLLRKQAGAYGLRRLGDVLLMPLRDLDGKLWSLQFIDAAGGKRFLRGGRVQGCFHRIGRPADGTPAVLLIGEGFATCASAHEATGHPAAVAHSAGNLRAVAEALRSRYPAADLILLQDDDPAGRSACERAARAVNGRVATVGGR